MTVVKGTIWISDVPRMITEVNMLYPKVSTFSKEGFCCLIAHSSKGLNSLMTFTVTAEIRGLVYLLKSQWACAWLEIDLHFVL